MNTANTPAGRPCRIDPEALIASGAIEGPYRPTHPVQPITLTWRTRIERALRRLLANWSR